MPSSTPLVLDVNLICLPLLLCCVLHVDGGGINVLNFLMLCTFFYQIASLTFSQYLFAQCETVFVFFSSIFCQIASVASSQYLVFVLTGDKKFER